MGMDMSELRKETGTTKTTIRNWVAQADRDAGAVRAGSRRDTTEAFVFMKAREDRHTIATMPRMLGTSRSGYYAWASRPPGSIASEQPQEGRSAGALKAGMTDPGF